MKSLLPLALLLATLPVQGVEIVAHRGASYDAPENTVASAQLAWENRADAVELDIWLTKDGQLAVIHDGNTKRTTGRDAKISALTLEEVRKLDAGSWKNPKYAGEKIPTLDEMLATLPAGKRIFIEIKTGPEGVPALVATLQRNHITGPQAVIISFNFDSIRAAKKALPHHAALWLANKPSTDPKKPTPSLEELLAGCHQAGLDGLDLNYGWPLDAAAVKRIHAANLQLHVWTVDDPAVAKHWVALGVDGITTNRAGWLRQQLNP
jgi:glycerophosphoryl diester phosphodiesterase